MTEPAQEESLLHIMSHLMKSYRHNVDLIIREFDVYPGQPPLLMRLFELNGLSQRELADKMNITPATLTVMIDRMQKTGLVERKADSRDQRISRVFLTEKGRSAAVEVKRAIREVEQRCFERFIPEEKLLLRRLLLHMQENLLS